MSESKELTRGGITRQEFARRLNMRLKAKGWSQSELSRRSTVQRDSVSAYCRGRSFPSNDKLEQLARALECDATELVPYAEGSSIEPRPPRFQIEAITEDSGHKLLTVHKMRIPNDIAAKIFAFLLEVDSAAVNNGAS